MNLTSLHGESKIAPVSRLGKRKIKTKQDEGERSVKSKNGKRKSLEKESRAMILSTLNIG